MTTKKADSSAARNNRSQHLPNDITDSVLVARVFSAEGQADSVDTLLDQASGKYIAVQVQNAFALAEASPATWRTFISHEFWDLHPRQRPKVDDQQSAPRFVLRIFFNGHASGAKRANDIWTAMQQLLHEDFTNAQVAAEFAKGAGKQGMDLKAVCRRAADRRRLSEPAKVKSTKVKTAAKPLPSAEETKGSAAATSGSPSAQKLIKRVSDAAAMDSLRLFFADGMDDFIRIQQGNSVVVTMKMLSVTKGGYQAELIKMKPKKS